VIILASPQHPIKAHRIKYYDDPLFKAMVERQEGKAFPYPPSVEGVGPWGAAGEDDEMDHVEAQRDERSAPVRDRAQRREARGMSAMAMQSGADNTAPEELEPETTVPKAWEDALDRQGDFIEELLGE